MKQMREAKIAMPNNYVDIARSIATGSLTSEKDYVALTKAFFEKIKEEK